MRTIVILKDLKSVFKPSPRLARLRLRAIVLCSFLTRLDTRCRRANATSIALSTYRAERPSKSASSHSSRRFFLNLWRDNYYESTTNLV